MIAIKYIAGVLVLCIAVVAATELTQAQSNGFKVDIDMNKHSMNPMKAFQGGCSACVGQFPVCLWCANSGPGCFTPPSFGAACCGCVNGACFLCPSVSSCATWSPFNPSFCPLPNVNNNSTVWPCTFQSKVTLHYQEKAVFRCHSIPVQNNAVVNWNMSPNSDGQFEVWVLDQRNFDLYISGQPFACLNQNCRQGGTNPKYGQFVNAGSPGYYFIVTKTNQNFSGTSSYWVNAFVR